MPPPSTKTISMWWRSPSSTPPSAARTATDPLLAGAHPARRPFIREAHVSTLTHTNGRLTSTTREERLLSFNARYRQQQFTRRNWTLLYGALFLAALSGSVAVSDFSIPGLIKGLPMAWNYIE